MRTTTTPATARVAIPAQIPGRKCWAKALGAIDLHGRGGHAVEGPWLDRGGLYDLRPGLLLLTVERRQGEDDRALTATLWRVDPHVEGGLDLVKTWRNKSGRIGPQIIKGLHTHLSKARSRKRNPAPYPLREYTPVNPKPRRNKYTRRCYRCGTTVAAGTGLISRDERGYRAEHEVCPPPVNRYAGHCLHCTGWIEAGQGILLPTGPTEDDLLARAVAFSQGEILETPQRWRPAHDGACPAVPAPRPDPQTNRWAGPCELCWQIIGPGRGALKGPRGDRHLIHPDRCPDNPLNPDGAPTWVVHERTLGDAPVSYDYPAGTIARVTLEHGPGEGPGWRELPEGRVSVIGVVIAALRRRHLDGHGRDGETVTTLWRVASPAEAERVLELEARRWAATAVAARARELLALLPGARPADAVHPPAEQLEDTALVGLAQVWLPRGAARPETRVHVDEANALVWTVVHNSADGDDWALSNWGGYIATAHPLTEQRRQLLDDLRDLQ
ncbi:hypothetical protein [Marinactinospora rubrisoli]|uniref:Uncharacterized protein n=1 Tax=Marinactinospora rubrisoli TaxID=2715399 RepID=A0ABW2KPL2_9ACTN